MILYIMNYYTQALTYTPTYKHIDQALIKFKRIKISLKE